MKKEQIIEILRSYKQILFETKSLAVWGIDSADYDLIADKILALQPSDADIEAWADGIANPESKKAFERGEWLGIKEGARAMRDGEI